MFLTTRYFYPNGNEGEEMECTFKRFETLEKAKAYCQRYAKGIRFAGCDVENEHGELLFEITSDFEEFDYVKEVIQNDWTQNDWTRKT